MTDEEIMWRLILGNINDDVALKNICEVHYEEMEKLTEKEMDFLIETNQFYYSKEQFCEMHGVNEEHFQELIDDETLIKTMDGYVWKNCV